MALVRLPTRTDDSIGRVKADLRAAENLVNYLRAQEYNVLADALIAVCRAVGLADGSTPGSLEQRVRDLSDELEAGDLSAFSGACEVGVLAGDAACVLPDGLIARADPTNPARMPAVGIVESVDGSTARVRSGLILRSVLSGLIPGKVYYVGANGRPSDTPPTALPGVEVDHQTIGIAVSTTALRVAPSTAIFIHRGT